MKKLILLFSLLLVISSLSFAALPISQEKSNTENVTPSKPTAEKKVKKENKLSKLYRNTLQKLGVPEGGKRSGILNGLSFGSSILSLLILFAGSGIALLSAPLAIGAVILGILGLSRGESLQGLGIAGIVIGGGLLLLFILAILILVSWLR